YGVGHRRICHRDQSARQSSGEFGCKLDNAADRVSDVRGANDRQNGVASVAISPDVKRLAEVAGLSVHSLRCGAVEESAEANRCVNGEAAESCGGRLQSQL